jgi:ABC-type siderophore export system fused ATPase/permease subunit
VAGRLNLVDLSFLGLSVSAQDVISKLQDRFYQLVRDAKASLMEQMKKTKLVLKSEDINKLLSAQSLPCY